MPSAVPCDSRLIGAYCLLNIDLLCHISCQSDKLLRRHDHFSILRHLGFVLRLIGPHTKRSGFYRYAKFGWNRPRGFEDMTVSMLCEFGLKCLFTPLFGGVLG